MSSFPIGPNFAPTFSLDSHANKLVRQTASPEKENAKIEKSAKDFESLLLGGWLQQAEAARRCVGVLLWIAVVDLISHERSSHA